MAKFKVRHLRKKGELYFFQPSQAMRKKGFYPEALGGDMSRAMLRAETLNADWDIMRKKPEPAFPHEEKSRHGTFGWLIERHMKSSKWKSRPEKTKREFTYYTGLLVKTRHALAANMERKNIRDLYDAMVLKKGYSKDKANRVIKWLRFLLSEAKEEGLRSDNPAYDLKLERNEPRAVVWQIDEVAAVAAKAAEMGRPSIGLAVMLGFDLGQRQGDILKLSWNQYDGKEFKIRQGKTGAFVGVALLKEMKLILESEPRKGIQLVISEETGRPYKADDFRHHFREIANAAGFKDKQFLDLRRSSVVRLSLAGATPQLIASITGHSIATVTAILKIYNPPTIEQARAAISLLEAYMGKTKKVSKNAK